MDDQKVLLFPSLIDAHHHKMYYPQNIRKKQKRTEMQKIKTYSSRDSHVVTHRSTNLPFNCLCMAERTGCPVFS
ncbi:hypothetical protein KCU93_g7811, partial [Aureobasidium melanogenum]